MRRKKIRFLHKKANSSLIKRIQNLNLISTDDTIEYPIEAIKFLDIIAKKINKFDGGLLTFDYGYNAQKNQNTLQSFSNTSSGVDGSGNLLYLWYPNKNGKAQLLYGDKSNNLSQAWSYINTESSNQIPTNKWELISEEKPEYNIILTLLYKNFPYECNYNIKNNNIDFCIQISDEKYSKYLLTESHMAKRLE